MATTFAGGIAQHLLHHHHPAEFDHAQNEHNEDRGDARELECGSCLTFISTNPGKRLQLLRL
jgi:hypothetical protein